MVASLNRIHHPRHPSVTWVQTFRETFVEITHPPQPYSCGFVASYVFQQLPHRSKSPPQPFFEMSRNAPPKVSLGGALRDIPNNGCEETRVMGALALSNLSFPQRFPRLGERLKETQCSRVYISLFSVFLSFTTYFLYRSETVRK